MLEIWCSAAWRGSVLPNEHDITTHRYEGVSFDLTLKDQVKSQVIPVVLKGRSVAFKGVNHPSMDRAYSLQTGLVGVGVEILVIMFIAASRAKRGDLLI